MRLCLLNPKVRIDAPAVGEPGMTMGLFSKLVVAWCAPLPAAVQVLAEALPQHVFSALLALLFHALLDAPFPLSLCESVQQLPFVLPAAHEVS